MDPNLDNQDPANPETGAVDQQSVLDNGSQAPAEDGASSYEVMKGEDGSEFFKVPKTAFEEMRSGVMRMEDYTRSKQTLQTLADIMTASMDSPQMRQQVKPQQAPAPTQQQSQRPQQDLSKMIPEMVQPFIDPLQRQVAEMRLDKEESEFKAKYGGILTGDPRKDNEIMGNIMQTAATHVDKEGNPISLEKAFFMTYGANILGGLQSMQQKQQTKKPWGTEDGGAIKAPSQVYRSKEDADLAVEEIIRRSFPEQP